MRPSQEPDGPADDFLITIPLAGPGWATDGFFCEPLLPSLTWVALIAGVGPTALSQDPYRRTRRCRRT